MLLKTRSPLVGSLPRRREADRPRRSTRPVAQLSAVLAGVMAGGMVLIQVVLLPFWRGLPPADFRQWFTENSGRIRTLMVPLGAAAGVVSAGSAVARVAGGRRGSGASVAAAVATAGVIAITVTVNEPANHRFTGGGLTDAETTDLLRRWARWHLVRVALGVAATVAATSALREREN
jgi:hypothetical protein